MKTTVYIGFVSAKVSVISWGSWNISPMDKGKVLYCLSTNFYNIVLWFCFCHFRGEGDEAYES
jgi:hypothetical protein